MGTVAPGSAFLVVDDDDVLRTRLGRALRERGFEVRTAADAAEAERLAREESPEFAVVDLRLPGASGVDLVKALRAIDVATQVVVLTGYGSVATAVEAVRAGAVQYLQKPADVDDLLRAFGGVQASGGSPPETPSLARAEWEYIQRVLADCGGNVSEAARRLGLHRKSLQRKLHKHPPGH